MNEISVPSVVGGTLKSWTFWIQDYSLLSVQSVRNIFTTRRYFTDLVQQMDLIGVGSLLIVATALLCVGGVVVLNSASQFARFGETVLTGDAVSLALLARTRSRVRRASRRRPQCHRYGFRTRLHGR